MFHLLMILYASDIVPPPYGRRIRMGNEENEIQNSWKIRKHFAWSMYRKWDRTIEINVVMEVGERPAKVLSEISSIWNSLQQQFGLRSMRRWETQERHDTILMPSTFLIYMYGFMQTSYCMLVVTINLIRTFYPTS